MLLAFKQRLTDAVQNVHTTDVTDHQSLITRLQNLKKSVDTSTSKSISISTGTGTGSRWQPPAPLQARPNWPCESLGQTLPRLNLGHRVEPFILQHLKFRVQGIGFKICCTSVVLLLGWYYSSKTPLQKMTGSQDDRISRY